MSKLTGIQILELMSDMRDHLILEAVPPAWWTDAPRSHRSRGASGRPSAQKEGRGRHLPFPVWFVRGGWIAAALGLLVAAGLVFGLFALRDRGSEPPGSTESDTAAEAVDPSYAAADRLLEQLIIPEEGTHLGMTANTDIRRVTETDGVTVGFREQHRRNLLVSGRSFRLVCTPYEQEEQQYLYHKDVLYVNASGVQSQSPLDSAGIAELHTLLYEAQGLTVDPGRLTAYDLFETVTVNPQSSNGTQTVVCEGLKRTAIQKLVGILRPTMETMGLVNGYSFDNEGNLVRDYRQAATQTRVLLYGMAAGSFTVTLTAASDGSLQKLELTTKFTSTLEDVSIDFEINGWASFSFSKRAVTTTGDMESYRKLHWRQVFGFVNAEAVGLVPDENGVYSLSSGDWQVWADQIEYILEHRREFEGKTFRVTGYTSGPASRFGDLYYCTVQARGDNNFYPYTAIGLSPELYQANSDKYMDTRKHYRCEILGTFTCENPNFPGFTVQEIVFP